jgi:hypothetical protein
MAPPKSFPRPTVGGLLGRLFPFGTQPGQASGSAEGVAKRIAAVPDLPTDVFAAAGLLLEQSGAYRYLVPQRLGAVPAGLPTLPSRAVFSPSQRQITRWTRLGREWRESPGIGRKVERYWRRLVHPEVLKQPLLSVRGTPQRWWRIAHALFVIADEACAGLGYDSPGLHSATTSWIEGFVRRQILAARGVDAIDRDRRHVRFATPVVTFCGAASPFVACVLPKARTPRVGCTMRALSHNLALLPPQGSGRSQWQISPTPLRGDHEPLNLLLVPFPYAVPITCFEPTRSAQLPPPHRQWDPVDKPWGWFALHQRWLSSSGKLEGEGTLPYELERDRGSIVAFLTSLIDVAKLKVGRIHGVIMPEYAVDWPLYNRLVGSIRDGNSGVDFIVAGSSSDFSDERGNFVLSTVFIRRAGSPTQVAVTNARQKHHRWCLDEPQITGYGLASVLDPFLAWWETSALGEPEINVTVFRQGSAFTSMICEDLARSEPCHHMLRAVGPNLVFALLMDGTQLPLRWSARYATVLADDPGSSVLTLTSRGLMARANERGDFEPSWNVGLWKDDTGRTVAIDCPPNSDAVVLTLSGQRASESTLDGRFNSDAWAWRFHGKTTLALPDRGAHRWIVTGT